MDAVTKDVCCVRVDTVTRTELGSACLGSPASLKGKLTVFSAPDQALLFQCTTATVDTIRL